MVTISFYASNVHALMRNPFSPQIPLEIEEDLSQTTPTNSQRSIPAENINTMPRPDTPSSTQNQEKPPKAEIEIIPPKLVINGVVWNSDRPQAIVNGKVIDVGDNILNAKITNINKEGIQFVFEGKEFSINYIKEHIKEPR